MTLAEGPRDQAARRETQLELNWSVLGRAFGQDGEERRERERERERETENGERAEFSWGFCGRGPSERSFLTDGGSGLQKSM
jgi:hypothetical protein